MSQQILLQLLGGLVTVVSGALGALLWYLIKSVLESNKQLAVLNEKIGTIVAAINGVPKMQTDLNVLHAKVRKLESSDD